MYNYAVNAGAGLPGPTEVDVSLLDPDPSSNRRPVTVNEVAREVGIPEKLFPHFDRFVNNHLAARKEFLQKLADPRRSYEDDCGYPRPGEVTTSEMYQEMYEWEAVPRRVVEVMARESWQVVPLVYESEDGKKETAWEKAWKSLPRGLRGEKSWFSADTGSLVWQYLKQADVECGISGFSVILLGLDDNAALSTPARPRVGAKLVYMRVFSGSNVKIKEMDTNRNSPRFGQPTFYTLRFSEPSQFLGDGGSTITEETVHWSRVVHVSEGDVFGTPRMKPVLRRLLDLQKLYGGSAEMYWRGAFPGLSLETDPRLGGDVDYDRAGMKDMMERYMNGLQRYLALNGFVAKSLAPQVVDPTPQINVQIEAICIEIGCPTRVFKGSERGELASSQDDARWNDRVRERENGHCTSRVVIPFADRLISLGVLPEPEEELKVWWPDLDSQTQDQKANLALRYAQALTQYASGGGAGVLTPFYFLTDVMGWTEARAIAALEAVDKAASDLGSGDETTSSPLLYVAGGILGMVELFKLAQSGGLTEEQLKQQLMLFFRLSEERAEEILADGLATEPGTPPQLPPGVPPNQPPSQTRVPNLPTAARGGTDGRRAAGGADTGTPVPSNGRVG